MSVKRNGRWLESVGHVMAITSTMFAVLKEVVAAFNMGPDFLVHLNEKLGFAGLRKLIFGIAIQYRNNSRVAEFVELGYPHYVDEVALASAYIPTSPAVRGGSSWLVNTYRAYRHISVGKVSRVGLDLRVCQAKSVHTSGKLLYISNRTFHPPSEEAGILWALILAANKELIPSDWYPDSGTRMILFTATTFTISPGDVNVIHYPVLELDSDFGIRISVIRVDVARSLSTSPNYYVALIKD